MSELTRQAITVAHRVWRHRWVGVAVAWAVGIAGVGASVMMQERYEARARIYVDTQTVLKPLMQGLTVQPDIDQQVRMLGRNLVSRPNVEKLVAMPELGLTQGPGGPPEARVDSLLRSIKVEQTGGNNLYAISYRDTDPERARKLVSALVSLFMNSGVDSKRRDSQDASRFIDEQISLYEAKLVEAEGRVKDFKLRNIGVASPSSNQDFFARMAAISDEVNRIRIQLSAAEQSRDALRRELGSEDPQLPENAASAVSATPELDSRIDAQRRQLDDLIRRYTDEHPDVIAARRTIEQLEAQRRRELDERARSGRGRGGSAATNPVYQKLRVSQAEAEADVAALRAQLGVQQGRLAEIRSQAGQVPQAEADLAQLTRDYEVIRKNYEELVTRRESAALGVKIDQTGSMADFRVIEPPRVLPWAVFPSRKQLALVTLAAALFAGLLASYAMTFLHPTFGSERELRDFIKRPVLGSVALVADPRSVEQVRRDRLQLLGAMGLFVLIYGIWLVWIFLRPSALA
ncbi:polysaccharide chain length determinant protein (PEP-CTERM system associated) [Sphaerotilus hippei]|uniref:Polysaccharide chain length determinant protein (PEP-CTERM system associated) n=1 Tax=Sphaerotilus hippei TaxID=744406 RepID=A0A318GXT6_9BURK|nr:XrtA system polysaccharide chain length determinant [Sphaerotilus hippei]PXW94124.1 polysaccharide chain length determinant protein (PEP-CTERM system associated) [Sphaerotilus hippei]